MSASNSEHASSYFTIAHSLELSFLLFFFFSFWFCSLFIVRFLIAGDDGRSGGDGGSFGVDIRFRQYDGYCLFSTLKQLQWGKSGPHFWLMPKNNAIPNRTVAKVLRLDSCSLTSLFCLITFSIYIVVHIWFC